MKINEQAMRLASTGTLALFAGTTASNASANVLINALSNGVNYIQILIMFIMAAFVLVGLYNVGSGILDAVKKTDKNSGANISASQVATKIGMGAALCVVGWLVFQLVDLFGAGSGDVGRGGGLQNSL